LSASLAHCIGRFLERRGLIERDENAWPVSNDDIEAAPLKQLRAASITYRIALGPRRSEQGAARRTRSTTWFIERMTSVSFFAFAGDPVSAISVRARTVFERCRPQVADLLCLGSHLFRKPTTVISRLAREGMQ